MIPALPRVLAGLRRGRDSADPVTHDRHKRLFSGYRTSLSRAEAVREVSLRTTAPDLLCELGGGTTTYLPPQKAQRFPLLTSR